MFDDESCWFGHKDEDIDSDDVDNKSEKEKEENESNDGASHVFRNTQKKQKKQ